MNEPTLAMQALVAARDDILHQLINDSEYPDEVNANAQALGITNPAVRIQRAQLSLLSQAVELVALIRKKYDPSRLPRELPLDLIWTGTPNAFAIHVPSDGSYAIGVDPTIFTAASLIAAFGYYALRSPVTDRNVAYQQYVDCVADTINAYFLGAPEKWRQDVAIAGMQILNSQEGLKTFMRDFSVFTLWFITSHEVAHIVLGHLESADAPSLNETENNSSPAKLSAFQHDNEFEADSWALKAVLDVACGNDIARDIFRAYPLIFFSTLNIIQRYSQPPTRIGVRLNSSHPPSLERLRRLREPLENPQHQSSTDLHKLPDLLQDTTRLLDKVLRTV